MREIAEGGWDLIDQTNPWNLIQSDSYTFSTGKLSDTITGPFDGGFAKDQESSWMAIIDLVQSCELQLDPLPDLQGDFNKATD